MAGNETLSNWYWRELTSPDVGAIVTQLHYRMLVNKFIAANRQLEAARLLDQFYKDPTLPAVAEGDVVARAIQLGVQEGALGIAEMRDGEIDPETLRYDQDVPLLTISFDEGVCLLSSERCQEILAQVTPGEPEIEEEEEEAEENESEGITLVGIGTGGTGEQEHVPPVRPQEKRYHRIRLTVADVPASKIADVNRGIFMPLSSAAGEVKFTMEIDVTSNEGISEATLDNRIKETIHQIGARIVEERLE